MYDISAYFKSLKQGFSQWYNKRNGRRGPLWDQRFKSVMVESSGHALATIAAYIDLNPLRAGIVADPALYRHCGYAAALLGGKQPHVTSLRVYSKETASAAPPLLPGNATRLFVPLLPST